MKISYGVRGHADRDCLADSRTPLDCDPGRRQFLGLTGSCAVGALLGIHWDLANAAKTTDPPPFDAWIGIEPNGQVVLRVAKAEMGQGVLTSLPTLLAEELDVDWTQVQVQQAPVDPARYDHLTVGSNSIHSLWRPLRVAGARARAGLIAAAAARWRVPPAACHTELGVVVGPGSQRAAYGELVAEAAQLLARPDPEIELKNAGEFRLIGRSQRRFEGASKTDGSAVYGIDVRLPGMLRAVVARCPILGGRLRSYDGTAARSVPGVRAVFPIAPEGPDAFTRGGVAIVAKDSWAALKGRQQLSIQWDEPQESQCSTRAILAALHRNTSRAGSVAAERGDALGALARNRRIVDASFELPFLAHATMEPMNATVHVRSDTVEAWLPTQNAADARTAIARVLRRAPDSITIHQTLVGGGFGRRDATDFVVEAAQVAALAGTPVQLLWSREDDVRFDRYRPAAVHRLRAALDTRGFPTAWLDRMSSVSIAAFLEPAETAKPAETEVGGARELPYDIPSFRIEYTPLACPVPVGWWRSVEDSINAFAVECFVDELAFAAGIDPLQYRLELLSSSRRIPERDSTVLETDRLKRVLTAVAAQAGRAGSPPHGRARGLACHACRGSYIAAVAEVSVAGGRVVAHRVWAAVDCGIVVNPLGVDAQVSGGLQFGASAALYEAVSIEAARVVQSNFNDYPVLRIANSPVTDVQILASSAPPSGVGEIAVPPVAPALANALFRLTGHRLRALPIEPYVAELDHVRRHPTA
jgi:isoquinoline 1-oxidoreductase beta subunit